MYMNDDTIIISICCYVFNKNYNIINKAYNLCLCLSTER